MGMSMGMMDPGMMGMMGPGPDLNMFDMPPGDLVIKALASIVLTAALAANHARLPVDQTCVLCNLCQEAQNLPMIQHYASCMPAT